MKHTYLLALALSSITGTSSLMGLSANINYGSFPSSGAALFQGSDGLAAESVSVGYFTTAANADLTGWNVLAIDSTFNTSTGANATTSTGVDVTAANGLEAWLLFVDGSLSGLIRANAWTTITGADAPAPIPTINFELGASDSASTVAFLQGAGSVVTISDNAGIGGSGISIQLTAVPEPSAYAALAGLLALGVVMVRRRRA